MTSRGRRGRGSRDWPCHQQGRRHSFDYGYPHPDAVDGSDGDAHAGTAEHILSSSATVPMPMAMPGSETMSIAMMPMAMSVPGEATKCDMAYQPIDLISDVCHDVASQKPVPKTQSTRKLSNSTGATARLFALSVKSLQRNSSNSVNASKLMGSKQGSTEQSINAKDALMTESRDVSNESSAGVPISTFSKKIQKESGNNDDGGQRHTTQAFTHNLTDKSNCQITEHSGDRCKKKLKTPEKTSAKAPTCDSSYSAEHKSIKGVRSKSDVLKSNMADEASCGQKTSRKSSSPRVNTNEQMCHKTRQGSLSCQNIVSNKCQHGIFTTKDHKVNRNTTMHKHQTTSCLVKDSTHKAAGIYSGGFGNKNENQTKSEQLADVKNLNNAEKTSKVATSRHPQTHNASPSAKHSRSHGKKKKKNGKGNTRLYCETNTVQSGMSIDVKGIPIEKKPLLCSDKKAKLIEGNISEGKDASANSLKSIYDGNYSPITMSSNTATNATFVLEDEWTIGESKASPHDLDSSLDKEPLSLNASLSSSELNKSAPEDWDAEVASVARPVISDITGSVQQTSTAESNFSFVAAAVIERTKSCEPQMKTYANTFSDLPAGNIECSKNRHHIVNTSKPVDAQKSVRTNNCEKAIYTKPKNSGGFGRPQRERNQMFVETGYGANFLSDGRNAAVNKELCFKAIVKTSNYEDPEDPRHAGVANQHAPQLDYRKQCPSKGVRVGVISCQDLSVEHSAEMTTDHISSNMLTDAALALEQDWSKDDMNANYDAVLEPELSITEDWDAEVAMLSHPFGVTTTTSATCITDNVVCDVSLDSTTQQSTDTLCCCAHGNICYFSSSAAGQPYPSRICSSPKAQCHGSDNKSPQCTLAAPLRWQSCIANENSNRFNNGDFMTSEEYDKDGRRAKRRRACSTDEHPMADGAQSPALANDHRDDQSVSNKYDASYNGQSYHHDFQSPFSTDFGSTKTCFSASMHNKPASMIRGRGPQGFLRSTTSLSDIGFRPKFSMRNQRLRPPQRYSDTRSHHNTSAFVSPENAYKMHQNAPRTMFDGCMENTSAQNSPSPVINSLPGTVGMQQNLPSNYSSLIFPNAVNGDASLSREESPLVGHANVISSPSSANLSRSSVLSILGNESAEILANCLSPPPPPPSLLALPHPMVGSTQEEVKTKQQKSLVASAVNQVSNLSHFAALNATNRNQFMFSTHHGELKKAASISSHKEAASICDDKHGYVSGKRYMSDQNMAFIPRSLTLSASNDPKVQIGLREAERKADDAISKTDENRNSIQETDWSAWCSGLPTNGAKNLNDNKVVSSENSANSSTESANVDVAEVANDSLANDSLLSHYNNLGVVDRTPCKHEKQTQPANTPTIPASVISELPQFRTSTPLLSIQTDHSTTTTFTENANTPLEERVNSYQSLENMQSSKEPPNSKGVTNAYRHSRKLLNFNSKNMAIKGIWRNEEKEEGELDADGETEEKEEGELDDDDDKPKPAANACPTYAGVVARGRSLLRRYQASYAEYARHRESTLDTRPKECTVTTAKPQQSRRWSDGDRSLWKPTCTDRFKTNCDRNWHDTINAMFATATTPFLDSHCHIDFLYDRIGFKGTFKKYMALNSKTFPKTFAGCVTVFCNPRSFSADDGLWKDVLEEENVWGTVGCHPKSATDFTLRAERAMLRMLQHRKMVAVGEIGLDYSGTFHQHSKVQKEVLAKQVKIALDLNKPIVIHSRESEDDIIKELEKHLPRNHCIHRHCFTAGWDEASHWLRRFPNSYIGLTPLVTQPRARAARETAANIPLDRLLLETDAPYFVPWQIPKRDMEFSHPGLAISVAEVVAKLKGLDINEVLQASYQNTCDMYGL